MVEAYGFGLPSYQKPLIIKKLSNIKYKEYFNLTMQNILLFVITT